VSSAFTAAPHELEFNGVRSDVPVVRILPLFGLQLLFGLFVAILLPCALFDMAFKAMSQRGDTIHAAWFFLLSVLCAILLLRWCLIQSLAFAEHWRQQPVDIQDGSWPLVSILVPAYQEAKTIVSALRSLVELDYPAYEIVVVDDGSSDKTYEKALAFVGDHRGCRLKLFKKSNGGKWSALNFAFQRAAGELIMCIDADSRLSRDALKRLVARLRAPGVWGVSGQITVRNRTSLLTRLQAFEYVVANGGLRMAQSLLGLVLVVPGPIGLYRRSALLQVALDRRNVEQHSASKKLTGPFSHETFAEDFQLSLTILALGGRIEYEPRALSYTKAPDLTHTLVNQRYRWFRGNMQVLNIFARRLRKLPQASSKLTAVVAGFYLLDLYLLPLVSFGAIFGTILSALASGNLGILLLWVSAVWLLNGMAGANHVITQGDDMRLIAVVPLYDLYHGLLLNFAWLIAFVDELRQTKMHW
jgi:poly-beta-1,6-N-acetyl-D-glucosamine synthase